MPEEAKSPTPPAPAAPAKVAKEPKFSVGEVVKYTNQNTAIYATVVSIRHQVIAKTKGDAEWSYYLDCPALQTPAPESLLSKSK